MKGLVLRSSKNLFTVRLLDAGGNFEPEEIECRIKGKVLKSSEAFYNPLAPGDLVEVEGSLILALEERRNMFTRFNQKGKNRQILAANVDLILCVCSVDAPPFRPRFLDRALIQADEAEIPAAIVCNKYDLLEDGPSGPAEDPDIEERLSDFERIGCPVFRISARTGQGMNEFKDYIGGKFSVLVGQSGVGKSSLINALVPGLEIRTGAVSEKYNRGNHTTTQPIMFDIPGMSAGTRIIDTPGIRRFAPAGIPPEDLILYMREFAPLAGKCSFGLSCTHETERGCKIMEAVHAGVIHEDRYESFLRIREELLEKGDFPND